MRKMEKNKEWRSGIIKTKGRGKKKIRKAEYVEKENKKEGEGKEKLGDNEELLRGKQEKKKKEENK